MGGLTMAVTVCHTRAISILASAINRPAERREKKKKERKKKRENEVRGVRGYATS
jgi:hypothetical protein